MTPNSLLLVEDHPDQVHLVRSFLAAWDQPIEVVSTLGEALDRIRRRSFAVVLLDLGLPDSRGIDTLVTLRTHAPRVAVVVMTADDELAVRSLHAGAQDFIPKGRIDPDLLRRALRYAAERQALINRLDEQRRQERSVAERKLMESLGAQTADSLPGPGWLLRQHVPSTFGELVERYATLLTRVEPGLGVEDHRTLAELADHLSAFHAGARDAIDLHQEALRRVQTTVAAGARAAVEDRARDTILELVALLADRYRGYLWISEHEIVEV